MAHPFSPNPQPWFDRAVSGLSQLPARLMLAVEDWREHFALDAELADLSAHGALDQALADVGLSRSEIPRVRKGHPSAVRQLTEVMRRLGLNPAELARDRNLKEVEWRCIECRAWHQCRAWLASNESGDGYRAFCPNIAAFDEILEKRGAARSKSPCSCAASDVRGGILTELQATMGEFY